MGDPSNPTPKPEENEAPDPPDQEDINLRLAGEKLELEKEKLKLELANMRRGYFRQALTNPQSFPVLITAAFAIITGGVLLRENYFKTLSELNDLRSEKAERALANAASKQTTADAETEAATETLNAAAAQIKEADRIKNEAKNETDAASQLKKEAAIESEKANKQIAASNLRISEARAKEESVELTLNVEEVVAAAKEACKHPGELRMDSLDQARAMALKAWRGSRSEEAKKAVVDIYSFPLRELRKPGQAQLHYVTYSQDGSRVLAFDQLGRADKVTVWDALTDKPLTEIQLDPKVAVHFHPIISPSGKLVATINDNSVDLWNAESGKNVAVLDRKDSWVEWAAFSPDGSRILIQSYLKRDQSDSALEVWLPPKTSSVVAMQGYSSGHYPPAYSYDGTRVAAIGSDHAVHIWSTATGEQLLLAPKLWGYETTLPDQRTPNPNKYTAPTFVSFSRDSRRFLEVDSGLGVSIRDASSGKVLKILDIPVPITAEFSPDPESSLVVTTSGNNNLTADIWDSKSGAFSRSLHGHTGWVQEAHFSPDGKRVVTTSTDGTSRVWDTASGKPLATLFAPSSVGFFSPEGRYMLSSSPYSPLIYEIVPAEEVEKIFP